MERFIGLNQMTYAKSLTNYIFILRRFSNLIGPAGPTCDSDFLRFLKEFLKFCLTFSFVNPNFSNELKIRHWPKFTKTMESIYHEVKSLKIENVEEINNDDTGEHSITGILVDKECKEYNCQIPTYIPQLSNVDRSLFAISVCTVDGQG